MLSPAVRVYSSFWLANPLTTSPPVKGCDPHANSGAKSGAAVIVGSPPLGPRHSTQLPSHALSRSVTAKADQPIRLIAVEAFDGVVETSARILFRHLR